VKPLRIGIACYPTYGGSGVLATELGLALAAEGHEVHLFSYARPTRLGSYHRGVEFHNVTVSSYPLFHYPPYDLALSSVMREVMAERELDILHVHYAVPHAICAYVAREMCSSCGTRIVTTLHGTDITILGRDPSYRDVIRFGLDKSDAVVSVSRWLEQQTREVFEYEGAIRVLPNFVDQERFRPRADDSVRRELGGDEHRLLVHMSNFRPLKRTLDTLEVLHRLPEDLPVRLLLVGDGPDLSLVRDAAARLGLTDRVRMLGEVDDVEDIIAAADVASPGTRLDGRCARRPDRISRGSRSRSGSLRSGSRNASSARVRGGHAASTWYSGTLRRAVTMPSPSTKSGRPALRTMRGRCGMKRTRES